ncbi:hypothetical protein RHSIM_Rhsim07G0225100 [Rhododendron simsii]|uniref:Uncharacterized protein n=1 Tax=Rhododendron simsii TaxID=118357 RepID=A0A834GKW6_RHOSS|nr:hypothetical protein RHSIM_Rhsim07G0225100 [Rhododendron simsii]
MSTTKGTGEVNEHGGVEKKVETVDYQKSAGHDDEQPKKETVEVNEHGGVEKKVETVDYRKSAGHEAEPPKKEDVEVIHCTEAEDPGVLEKAGEVVKEKIQSVKEAASNIGKKEK